LDDPIQSLLNQLLAAKDPAEIDRLSVELRAALHDRISSLREDARSISHKGGGPDRRKNPRRTPDAKKR
jgi:hypothetical protein